MAKLKYKPGDRVSFESHYTNGERPRYDGAVLSVHPEWDRPYVVYLDAYVWHGPVVTTEDRLTRLGGVDGKVLRWLRDRVLVGELRLFGHKESADRLEDLVGKRYDGIER